MSTKRGELHPSTGKGHPETNFLSEAGTRPPLEWKQIHNYEEVILGREDDGVRFTFTRQPTCYRRGPYKLLIEVLGGPHHNDWGCFDEQDQPCRYYHNDMFVKPEADAIANVLWRDRFLKTGFLFELSLKNPHEQRDCLWVLAPTRNGLDLWVTQTGQAKLFSGARSLAHRANRSFSLADGVDAIVNEEGQLLWASKSHRKNDEPLAWELKAL